MQETLDKLVVISIESRIWSGRKKLRPLDIDKKTNELPPKELVSLGSRKVFDPVALQPFQAFKRELEAMLQDEGIKFAKNIVLPRSAFDALIPQISDVLKRFKAEVDRFVFAYPQGLIDWRNLHPAHEKLLEDAPTQQEVASRFYLGYRPFAIGGTEVPGPEGTPVDNTEQLVSGLAGRIYVDVAKMARSLLVRLKGRQEVQARFLNPIRTMEGKLAGLSFIDSGIKPMLDDIQRVMATLPNAKRLAGNDVHAVRGLLTLLADPAGLRSHSAALGNQASLLTDDEDDSFEDSGVELHDAEPVDAEPVSAEPVAAEPQSSLPDLAPMRAALFLQDRPSAQPVPLVSRAELDEFDLSI